MQKFPKAPLPAEDATKRLRQMKELLRQIKAFEYFKPGNQIKIFEYFRPGNQIKRERYELRTLPQPVHRYADARSGLIDGGMFIISYGLNPEIVLLLETRAGGLIGGRSGITGSLGSRSRSFTWISRASELVASGGLLQRAWRYLLDLRQADQG